MSVCVALFGAIVASALSAFAVASGAPGCACPASSCSNPSGTKSPACDLVPFDVPLPEENGTDPLCDVLESQPAWQSKYGPSAVPMYTSTGGVTFGPRKESYGVGWYVVHGGCNDLALNTCTGWNYRYSGWSKLDLSGCGTATIAVPELNDSPTFKIGTVCRSWYTNTDAGDEVYAIFSTSMDHDQLCGRPLTHSPFWTSAQWTESAGRRYACQALPLSGYTVNSTFMNGSSWRGLSVVFVSIGNAPCEGPPTTTTAQTDVSFAGVTAQPFVQLWHLQAISVFVVAELVRTFASMA